ncbi:MAG TPA: hypothetical protein VFH27_14190 [Longimicrobiaceae bacterium]|nr:hypothetical protein [Longimicrobiaceae bacterium]
MAIDEGGEWNANGWGSAHESDPAAAMRMASEGVGPAAARYWVDAELPISAEAFPEALLTATVRIAAEPLSGAAEAAPRPGD